MKMILILTNFLDLIPEPIITVKILKIFFANIKVQVHFEKKLNSN